LFFKAKEFLESNSDGSNSDELEVKIWHILTNSLYDELNNMYFMSITENETSDYNLNEYLKRVQHLLSNKYDYPCSYLLFYRSMLLDKNQQENFEVYSFCISDCIVYICVRELIFINRVNNGIHWLYIYTTDYLDIVKITRITTNFSYT